MENAVIRAQVQEFERLPANNASANGSPNKQAWMMLALDCPALRVLKVSMRAFLHTNTPATEFPVVLLSRVFFAKANTNTREVGAKIPLSDTI